MNMKISSSLLALATLTSTSLLGFAPVSAQSVPGNGSTVGNNIQFIFNTAQTAVPAALSPTAQANLNQFSQSITPNSVGSSLFNVFSGGSPTALALSLVPSGAAVDGSTAMAAAKLAQSLQGIRDGGGNLNPSKLSTSTDNYNEYIKAMVSEIGGAQAIASLTDPQKSADPVVTLGSFLTQGGQSLR
jgi:hypothetical protein